MRYNPLSWMGHPYTATYARYLEDKAMEFRNPGTPLTDEQKILRKEVYRQISDEPESLYMNNWEGYMPTCGTTRCVAGWAQHFMTGQMVNRMTVKQDAVTGLGLTEAEYFGRTYYRDQEAEFESSLFYLSNEEALERMRQLVEEA